MLSFEVFGITDSGCVRRENEDALDWHLSCDKQLALGVLADGMGGYFGGSIASQLAVKTVLKSLKGFGLKPGNPDCSELESIMLAAGNAANDAVVVAREKQSALAEMGTTLVAAAGYGDFVTVMHAGDSRCYRMDSDGLRQLTRDDSVVQQMMDDGSITHIDAARAPFRHMLTKSLGVERKLQYSMKTFKAKAGQYYLLCSDGLYQSIDNITMASVLFGGNNIKKQVRELIERSIAKRAEDNISAILIKVNE
jgi:protein phosphatase